MVADRRVGALFFLCPQSQIRLIARQPPPGVCSPPPPQSATAIVLLLAERANAIQLLRSLLSIISSTYIHTNNYYCYITLIRKQYLGPQLRVRYVFLT